MERTLRKSFLLFALFLVSLTGTRAQTQNEEFKDFLCKKWVISHVEKNGTRELPDEFLADAFLVINRDNTGKASAGGQTYPGKWKYSEDRREFTISSGMGNFKLKLENLSARELTLSFYDEEDGITYRVFLVPGK